MKFRAFTMVEILIGASLLVMVLGGLYSIFSGVGRTQKSISGHSHLQTLSYRIFKVFKKDIRNSFELIAASNHSIEFKIKNMKGGENTVKWIYSPKSKMIKRIVDAKKTEDFSSRDFIASLKFNVYDLSKTGSGGSLPSNIKDLCVGKLIADLSMKLILKKGKYGAGFFKREYSRVSLKGAKF